MRNLLVLLGLSGLFLGWNAPNHYPPWTAFHLELFSAVGVCLLGAAAFIRPLQLQPAGLTRIPLPIAARVWLLAALWPVLQYLAGGLAFRGDALVGLLYGLGAALSLYVGLVWAAQQGRDHVLRMLCITFVLGGLVADGLALVQWLRLGTPGWWAMELIDDRPYASFAQPNHFGLLMVMAIVAVTALFEMGAVQRRWVHGLAVAFFGWGVLMSQSRASGLALIAVAGVWLLTRGRVPTRLRLAHVLCAAVVGLALSLAIEPMQQALLLKSSEFRAPADVGPRKWIWLHFWAAILERPWLGHGFYQGVQALAEVAGQVQPSRNVIFAHNMVLDLMTWVGIPLALAATVALGAWMLGWLRNDPDTALMAQRHWVFAIWLALMVQSMLEFPYAHSYFLLPAALLAGAITALPARAQTHPGGAVFAASRWAMTLAAGTTLFLGVLAWEYFQLEEDFRFNRFERANFSTRHSHDALERPWVLDQLAALNASAHSEIRPGLSSEQLRQLKVLARRFHMLSTRLDYAKALALNGRPQEAEAEMQIIRSVCWPAQYRLVERQWQLWLKANVGATDPSKATAKRP